MNILVFAENSQGRFKKSSLELLTFANYAANVNSGKVYALSFGELLPEGTRQLAQYGADSLINITDKSIEFIDNQLYTKILSEAVRQFNINLIVFQNNFTGKALAPRLSAALKCGMISGITGLPSAEGQFVKQIFSGKVRVEMKITSTTSIVSLSQNSIQLQENPKTISTETWTPDLKEFTSATKLLGETKTSAGKILLTDAEIVVSGGRGMKGPENWKPIEELAEILGAATACSRPVSDEGWRPHHEHVGQTGLMVAPNLYIALGISGAIQHLAGINSSKVIIAVNKDHEAPIFEAATYGIIGDVQTVIPKLIDEARKLKQA